MSTLADLVQPYTADQIKAAIYEGIAESGVNTTSWKPGAVLRTFIAIFSIILAAFSQLISLVTKGGFLDLSEKEWLTAKARYDYDTDRILGTFATGTVTLTNGGDGVFGRVQPGDLVVAHDTTGKLYVNTEEFSLFGAGATLNVQIRAVEVGTESNANPGEITKMVSAMSGVTCSNAAALIALDEESDPALRTRARAKIGTLSSSGPPDAYFYRATSAKRADGSAIGITRVRTKADGIGGVDVYVANAVGTCAGTPDDITSDLGAVNAGIQAYVAPLGITARLHAATPLPISIGYEIWLRNTGLSEAAVKSKISAAIAAYLSTMPIGGERFSGTGRVYATALETIIGAAIPGAIIEVVLGTPSADVVVALTEAPVLSLPITAVVHLINETTS
jgi:phage-related baseplate assembly protein